MGAKGERREMIRKIEVTLESPTDGDPQGLRQMTVSLSLGRTGGFVAGLWKLM